MGTSDEFNTWLGTPPQIKLRGFLTSREGNTWQDTQQNLQIER